MFVAHLFDKDLLAVWPGNLPLPYNSENPPSSLRTFAFLNFFTIGY
jgi:hypothetical protein